MTIDGPILVVTHVPGAPLMEALATRLGHALCPVTSAEAAATLATAQAAGIVVLDEPDSEADADALTAAILACPTFVPAIRAWNAEAATAARPATLWAPSAPSVDWLAEAVERSLRVRLRLLEADRRRDVLSEAALLAPLVPDPWAAPRDAAILLLDTGLALTRVAPICAARGMGIVGAPTQSIAGTYLDLRSFDCIVIGPSIDEDTADSFVSWLRDDPRRRDLPVFRLLVRDSGESRSSTTEYVAIDDPRLTEALVAAVRLHALDAGLVQALGAMDMAGLADPDTGLLWPDAFRAGLAQSLRWNGQTAGQVIVLKVRAEEGGPPLPATVARMTARLLRRSDLVTRLGDGTVLAALVGSGPTEAKRVAGRIAGVLSHTMIGLPGEVRRPVKVGFVAARSGDSAASFFARLAGPDEGALENLLEAV